MAVIKKNAPRKSICLILFLTVMSVCGRGGFLKKNRTVPRAMPPNGRLIQKHLHRLLVGDCSLHG